MPPNHWELELDGLTGSSDRVVVALRRRGGGGPVLLEIVGLEHHVPLSEVVPESLRQSDVTRVEAGVAYYTPRTLTVLEEAGGPE